MKDFGTLLNGVGANHESTNTFEYFIDTIPLPPDRDSSHRQTAKAPETRHQAGVV
jgi:hypothetical protein